MILRKCRIFIQEIIMQELYKRIIDKADKFGITGKELGNLLGLKKSPLTDWKNDKSNPTLEQLMKMCEIFATTADELLFGNNPQIENLQLTGNEKELLDHFKKLPEREQIKFIGRVEEAAIKYQAEHRELKSSDSKIG